MSDESNSTAKLMTTIWTPAAIIAASGVHSPIQSKTAVPPSNQRPSETAVSGRSVATWAALASESPAANRRTSSPSPGQELGNVENNLCTSKYGTGVELRGNPQKGEI